MEMYPYDQLPLIFRFKLCALFINGKNETVICYIEVPFKAGLTVFIYIFFNL